MKKYSISLMIWTLCFMIFGMIFGMVALPFYLVGEFINFLNFEKHKMPNIDDLDLTKETMNDIVTRLRDHENEGVTSSDRFQLREEAAAEIEFLRKKQGVL